MSSRPIPKHLHSLDALRGIAALAVVLWHWQHFFYVGSMLPTGFDRETQPLFPALSLFYTSGAVAVDLFFSISGFVFFWLYADAISSGRVSAREFFVLRVSRLYPLHLLTLMIVLVGQSVYKATAGLDFVYPHNDPYHFVLNVFFVQSIGLERGYSFNSPTWSVSVEVVLYALFFLLCRWRRLIVLAAFMLVGFWVAKHLYSPLGKGIGYFFLGGCVFQVYARILQWRHARRFAYAVCLSGLVLWLLVLVSEYAGVSFRDIPVIGQAGARLVKAMLIPVTILALALGETYASFPWRRISFLGDISYASYLWHFPLQMAVVLVGANKHWFTSALSLFIFFGMLILLSLASHRWFEMPMQRVIRRRLRRVSKASVAGAEGGQGASSLKP